MVKLELEVNEVNVVLGALGQLPFAQVADLVVKVREQAIPQVQEQQAQEPAVTE